MSPDRPVLLEPGQDERPTQAAQLKITAEPAQVRITAEALAAVVLIPLCNLVQRRTGAEERPHGDPGRPEAVHGTKAAS